MKILHHFLLLILCLLLVSCVGVYSSRSPDGAEKQLYAQVGMKVNGVTLPQGGEIKSADGEKSFGQAMTAAGAAVTAYTWGAVEKAKSATSAATAQTGIKAGAATDQARIKATERTVLGTANNPEVRTDAIQAVGNIYR